MNNKNIKIYNQYIVPLYRHNIHRLRCTANYIFEFDYNFSCSGSQLGFRGPSALDQCTQSAVQALWEDGTHILNSNHVVPNGVRQGTNVIKRH